MANAFQISRYHGAQTQRLRYVTLISPSIIWVIRGQKRVQHKGGVQIVTGHNVLLNHAAQTLTFENVPYQQSFKSVQLSFLTPPSQPLLELSAKRAESIASHPHSTYGGDLSSGVVTLESSLLKSLNILSGLDLSELSSSTQQFWLFGLYQQLAEQGFLQRLFPQASLLFTQQLGEFFMQDPSLDYQLNEVCQHFAMSRATLIRRLKKEGSQFRELLTQVRVNHGLYLMQQGEQRLLDLSLMCGYKSPTRFNQRFKAQFGISAQQYMKSLKPLTAS